MADFADMFLAAGYAVLLPDSRAHGEAAARSSPTGCSKSSMRSIGCTG
jgi:alpha-beta hydrolase superfamily lysophospholipase